MHERLAGVASSGEPRALRERSTVVFPRRPAETARAVDQPSHTAGGRVRTDVDSATDPQAVAPRRASLLAQLRHRALSITPTEVSFQTRRFYERDAGARATLERHGTAFVDGFNVALLASDVDDLATRLLYVAAADRGFAFEGSAMALGILDLMSPGRGDRLGRLVRSNHGSPHIYMLHVGAGWSTAQMHLRPLTRLRAIDPFLRWLVVDGHGFHHGFFKPKRWIDDCAPPRRLRGYEHRAFDQGLGRSMWFAVGADVDRAARTVSAFPEPRRGDLWSGLGLAASYTTAANRADLERLGERSGAYRPRLAQGAAFAVAARQRAGNVLPHTTLAAEVLCEHSIEDVVALVDEARADLRADADGSSYELWRTRISEVTCHGPALSR
jgi:hypothetical protein